MFRILPHRVLTEPRAAVDDIREAEDGSTATLRIEGLVCSACAANVGRSLEALDGVERAQVDLDRGEARVTYDPSRATPEALVRAVEGAALLRPLRRLIARFGGGRGHT